MIQTEHWMLYYDPHYEAVPWPFGVAFDQFVAAPRPLPHACEELGRVSPTDGRGETPMVPANLPRQRPRGDYRFAVYHDVETVYVVLESKAPPALATFEGGASVIASVNFLSADERFMIELRGFSEGAPVASVRPAAMGTRAPKTPGWAFDWSFRYLRQNDAQWCCWRIARASLSPVLEGKRMRFAVSHTDLNAIEAVAWGAYHIWEPRHDEFGVVRLVDELIPREWPRVRRVDLDYVPGTETGVFRVAFDAPYATGEGPLSPDMLSYRVPMEKVALTFDDRMSAKPIEAKMEWAMAVPDGRHRVLVAHTGGPAVHIELEKWSGRTIRESPLPPTEPMPFEQIKQHIVAECEARLATHAQRRAKGNERGYAMLEMRSAAALARVYQYIHPDPRILEALRDEADFALSLQREDGTFAGFHLSSRGDKGAPWRGGAYDSGPAGELWVMAAWLLRDEKYLEASRRLVKAFRKYRIEFNHNYASIGLFHLAAHYRLTRDEEALEHALHHARHTSGADIFPLGYQGGHNYYTVYGCLTLRGLSHLCSVLPAGHPFRETLLELCVRMTNQLFTRLQPSGLPDGRNRFHVGDFMSGVFWQWAFAGVGLLLDASNVKRVDTVLQAMLRLAGDKLVWCDADLLHFLVSRDALLEGRPVDLLTLH